MQVAEQRISELVSTGITLLGTSAIGEAAEASDDAPARPIFTRLLFFRSPPTESEDDIREGDPICLMAQRDDRARGRPSDVGGRASGGPSAPPRALGRAALQRQHSGDSDADTEGRRGRKGGRDGQARRRRRRSSSARGAGRASDRRTMREKKTKSRKGGAAAKRNRSTATR